MKDYLREHVYIDLPKWPQMLVWGTPVTREQAIEIIRRTDDFVQHGHGGNDQAFTEAVREMWGIPHDGAAFQQWKWSKRGGVVHTEYVTNAWISTSYIHGPHGWCYPDGTIHHCDNVGKWPNAEEIFDDWIRLARAFPFLDLQAVLLDDEMSVETKRPLLLFDIKDGKAWACRPDHAFERFGKTISEIDRMVDRSVEAAIKRVLLGGRSESAFTLDELRSWKL